jgi:DNA polymerase III epsilon subunit-like protein
MRAMIADTETGDIDPAKASLLSVGATVLDLNTGETIEEFEYFVKLKRIEDYIISPGAFKVHGITAEKCFKEGLTPAEIADKLMDLYINTGAS